MTKPNRCSTRRLRTAAATAILFAAGMAGWNITSGQTPDRRDPAPPGRTPRPIDLTPAPLPGAGALPGQGINTIPTPPPLAPPAVAQPGIAAGAQNGNVPGEVELADARAALAERLSADAVNAVRKYVPSRVLFEQAAAELDMAVRLAPSEPRYSRLLAEAWIELGNVDSAIEALQACRKAIKAAGTDDQVLQVKLIELYLARMQVNSEKLRYLLGDIVGNEGWATEVRSYAASRAVPILLERSRSDAITMTRRAIELNPLNPQARQWEWELIAQHGTPAEQLASLLAIVRCNPADAETVRAVAITLASVGLSTQSLDWFERGRLLSLRTNVPVSEEFALGYCSQLYRAGLYEVTNRILGDLLQQKQDNVDAWFMALSLHRDAVGLGIDQEIAQVKRLLVTRATEAGRKIIATAGAAAPAVGDNLSKTVQVLQTKKDVPQDLRRNFIEAVSDLSWFEAFYNRRPDDARAWADALAKLLPAGDPLVARLQGWAALSDNDFATARAKLAPLQETDPLAGLGMVFVLRTEAQGGPTSRPAATQPATQPAVAPGNPGKLSQADALSRRLLARYPDNLVGMMLAGALRGPGGRLDVDPIPAAEAVKAALEKFPTEFMRIVEPESATGGPNKFYIVSGKSVSSTGRLGDPMLAEIKVQNNGPFDLAVGVGGTIRPDLWWDGVVSSVDTKTFPAAGYDTLSGLLVLKAKGSAVNSTLTQTVRIDYGAMSELLSERPAASMNVYLTLLTNPIDMGQEVDSSPGGMKRRFAAPFIRRGTPVNNQAQKTKLYNQAQKDLPPAKMQAADVFAAYIRQSREKGADVGLTLLATEMQQQLEKLKSDAVPQVAAWASVQLARLAEEPARAELIRPLAKSDLPETRLLAAQSAPLLPAADRDALLKALSADADPAVRVAAQSQSKMAVTPPVRRPKPATPDTATTQPSAPTPTTPTPGLPRGALSTPGLPSPGRSPATSPADPVTPPGSVPAPTDAPSPSSGTGSLIPPKISQ